MTNSFENPFVPDSKKANKSLLNKKNRIGKVWPESIKKIDELLALGHYGDLELYQKEVDFLHDLEPTLITAVKRKTGINLSQSEAQELIQKMCIAKNNRISNLNLSAAIKITASKGRLIVLNYLPPSITNLKNLKSLNLSGGHISFFKQLNFKKLLPNVKILF